MLTEFFALLILAEIYFFHISKNEILSALMITFLLWTFAVWLTIGEIDKDYDYYSYNSYTGQLQYVYTFYKLNGFTAYNSYLANIVNLLLLLGAVIFLYAIAKALFGVRK